MAPEQVVLDGESLTLADLARVARDPRVKVSCAAGAVSRVAEGERQVQALVRRYQAAYDGFRRRRIDGSAYLRALVYGVSTGFGEFKHIPVPPERLIDLQRNLLLSHSVGVGDNTDADDPANYFSAEVVRGALLLRLNAFLRGHSGVRLSLLRCVEALLNRGIVPLVPLRGSLGASGDLCPLAHLFAVLVGAGRYYRVTRPEDLAPRRRRLLSAASAPPVAVPRPAISYKEGLALTNGANFSAAMLGLAVLDAQDAAHTADVAAALTLEALCGRREALDPRVHRVRGQRGQVQSAADILALVGGSRMLETPTREVQDAYSLRCAPQVHGASRDALAYARMVAEREINAVTDNPLFFADESGAHQAYSAGNFHAQPIALASDFLTIALCELASISERRAQMLLDSHHNRGLAPNLVAEEGLNSGCMIAQYTAASLVSENKVLAHPASVDSIPSSSNSEDHVSMAPIAARKLRTVLGNTQATLAIELLLGAQAVEWRALRLRHARLPPLPAEPTFAQFARRARERAREKARFEAQAQPKRVARLLGAGTRAAYLAVRAQAAPVLADRPLDDDIRRVRAAVASGDVARRARQAVPGALAEVPALVPGDPRG